MAIQAWKTRNVALIKRFFPEGSEYLNRYRAYIDSRLDDAAVVLNMGAGVWDLRRIWPAAERDHTRIAKILNCDLDPARLRLNPAPRKVAADAACLPVAAGSVDLIVTDCMFEHLPDPTRILTEFRHALKPGGAVVFATPNRYSYISLVSALTPTVLHRWMFRLRGATEASGDCCSTYYRLNSARAIARHARAARLETRNLCFCVGHPSYSDSFPPWINLLFIFLHKLMGRFAITRRVFATNLVGVLEKPTSGSRQFCRLSIIIPVYNEERTVLEIVGKVQAVQLQLEKEIIVVDDGSHDRTPELLTTLKEAKGVRVHTCPVNQGKGAAIRTGLGLASGDIVLIQDADLELDPNEYPELIAPIVSGQAQVVYGSRFSGGRNRALSLSYLANRFLIAMTNLLYGAHITDMETCYKVFRRDVIRRVRLCANRFEFEPEVTAKVLRLGHRIHEVPISYRPRSSKEGKKIKAKDGILAAYHLLKWRVARRAQISTPAQEGPS